MKQNPWIATAMQLPVDHFPVHLMDRDGNTTNFYGVIRNNCWQCSDANGYVLDMFPYWRIPRTPLRQYRQHECAKFTTSTTLVAPPPPASVREYVINPDDFTHGKHGAV